MSSNNYISQSQYARFWILLSLFCLFYSGAIALAITFAKLPVVGDYLKNIDIIRWSLVIHVNLATIVWFSAFPLGLIYKKLSLNRSKMGIIPIISAFISLLGVMLIILDFPNQELKIFMSNYVPVLNSNQFLTGLYLYLIGAGASYLYLLTLINIYSKIEYIVGSVFFIFSLLTLGFSFLDLNSQTVDFDYYEYLWWGFGHLLQHASTAFCLVCWYILLKSSLGKSSVLYFHKRISFVLLFIPILFVPFIILESSTSEVYRKYFTYLMQYGIFPGILYFIVSHIRSLSRFNYIFLDYRYASLIFSVLLMLIGFVFGSFIRGPDLRVPAHYHAVIGAVTLAFMVVCYEVFIEIKNNKRWIFRCIYIFTIGQIIFSSALFIAGVFGYERKTYAAENTVTTLGQNIIFILMPVGGLMAFAGGVCFAVAILKDRKQLK